MIKEAIDRYCSRHGIDCTDLKLFMFDMDGVLFDSMPYHAKAWRMTLLEEGMDFDENIFYLHEGRTCESTVRIVYGKNLSAEECKRIYARKSAIFDSLQKIKPMPGALDVATAVKDRGLEAIVVTGSGHKALFEHVRKHYPGIFHMDWMVSSSDVVHGKPDPEPYLMGLKKAGGLNPSNAIVIENAPLGVKAGHDSGCFVIGVNTGPVPDQMLIDAGADIIFPSMSALAGKIDEIITLFQERNHLVEGISRSR